MMYDRHEFYEVEPDIFVPKEKVVHYLGSGYPRKPKPVPPMRPKWEPECWTPFHAVMAIVIFVLCLIAVVH